jgi:monofunctional glycosyltransferase
VSVLEAGHLATISPNPRNYRADAPGPYVARLSEVIAARIGQVSRDRLDACIYH